MNSQSSDAIQSYHAHIYFDDPEQRAQAEKLRDEIAQQFPVLVSRLVNWPVGPHVKPMFQVNFPPAEFGSLVPWLIVKRRGLSVLIHPNSGRPRRDHADSSILWLGEPLPINAEPLPERDGG